MNHSQNFIAAALVAALCAAIALPAWTQDVLPRPPQPFKGKIGRTVKDSTPDFPKAITAPKGAPNVLLILTDDVAFGSPSVFAGQIPPPTMYPLPQHNLPFT